MRLERRDLSPGVRLSDAADLCGLLPTGCWLVEAGGQPPDWHLPCLKGGSRGGVAISLSSATLMETELGLLLAARLLAEGYELPQLAGLALHEMVVNAVVHGNLEVGSGAAARWDDLSLRQTLIEQALADPVRAGRLVTLAAGWDGAGVVVTVADEGCGYAAAPPVDAAGQARRASGRGLFIARAAGEVSVAADGRCTRLALACAGPASVD